MVTQSKKMVLTQNQLYKLLLKYIDTFSIIYCNLICITIKPLIKTEQVYSNTYSPVLI